MTSKLLLVASLTAGACVLAFVGFSIYLSHIHEPRKFSQTEWNSIKRGGMITELQIHPEHLIGMKRSDVLGKLGIPTKCIDSSLEGRFGVEPTTQLLKSYSGFGYRDYSDGNLWLNIYFEKPGVESVVVRVN